MLSLPHGRTLPERQWQSRHRALRWLLWAHVAAMPVISLLFDQGLGAGRAGLRDVDVFAVLAQLRLGGRRAQSLVVTFGLLTCSALLVHVSDGLSEAYFHFFVMVAALSLYEDWLPFGDRRRVRADPAGDHGRARRLRPRRIAVAVGARALGVRRRAEPGVPGHLARLRA